MAGDQLRFQKMMNQGHSAAWEQSWEKAAGFYRLALEEFPDHPMALNSLGLALFEIQEYDEALRRYQQAAKITPNDPIPLEKIARISERQGKPSQSVTNYMQAAEMHLKAHDVEKAIENWNQILKLQPENQTAHTKLAMVNERLGRRVESVREYIAIASLLQHRGEKEKALQVIDYALKIMPDNVDAQQSKMLVKTDQKLALPERPQVDTGPLSKENVLKLPAARVETKKELDPIDEGRQKALEVLAGLLFEQEENLDRGMENNRRGLSALARGAGTAAHSSTNRSKILLHLGQAIESQTHDQNAQAEEELERAVEAGLDNPATNFNIGLLKKDRDSSTALIYLQKSVKNPDFALASYLLMGQIYEQEGKLSDAASAFLRALSLADSQTVPSDQAESMRQIYEPIIEFQSRQSNEEDLRKLCGNIYSQLLRKDWRNYLNVARQQLPKQEENGLPLPLAEMFLETRGGKVVESLAHIRKLTGEQKFRSAMEEAYRTLQEAPTYLPLHVQIGDILFREGHTRAAIDKYILIARLYALRGEASQAIQLLFNLTKAMPMDVSIRTRLIDLLKDQGRNEEAIEQFIELANIHYHQAELDLARKHYMNALHFAQSSLTSRETVVRILYKIADIDQQRLDWREAAKIYEQICALVPEDPQTRVQLSTLKIRLGREKEALQDIDEYISMLIGKSKRRVAIDFMGMLITEYPGIPELRNRLAELYIQDGQILEAVDQLDAIAEEMLNANNRFGAISVLQKIISLDPPNVDSFRDALNQLRGK